MWRKYDAISLATPEGFNESPSLVWQFYHYRRESALRANPNKAHRALSAFSLASFRDHIAPESTFTLITQNVDGLSPRADREIREKYPITPTPLDPGLPQPTLIEMHGRLFDVVCRKKKCKHIEFNTASPICEALSGTEELVEQGTNDPEIDLAALPRCSKCGSLARPGVVWFGEEPHHLGLIDDLVEEADLCLVIGTSSTVRLAFSLLSVGVIHISDQVHPAASYAHDVKSGGGKVAVFNLERSEGDSHADYLFLGPCEETIPTALGLVVSDSGEVTVSQG